MNQPSLSRRGALFGAACLFGCTHAPSGPTARPALTCTDVMAAPASPLTHAEEEQHCIFLLLAMAMVYDGWGVDRRRPELVAAYAAIEPNRRFPDYAGHNIGAVLVDETSNVIGFALNRSVQLNSTLEHAEARTIRNAIRRANAATGPGGPRQWSYGALLRAHRLYATLEPCSQCAGIMDIANIAAVIYGQDDPPQHHIVNVLYNLHDQPGNGAAPLPIRAAFMPYWDQLAAGYDRFVAEAAPGARTGLTSFLETVEAYVIYRDAASAFAGLRVQAAGNDRALQGAQAFRARWRGQTRDGAAPT